MITYEHPLHLPPGWTPSPVNSRLVPGTFNPQISLNDALRYLEEEIHALEASHAVISSNYEHLASERMRKRVGPAGNGVAILLKLRGLEAHLACDKWAEVQHNAYALHLALRNLRMMEEWGVAATYRLLTFFSGSHALPIPDSLQGELPDWMQLLGLGPSATVEDANATYRRRAKEHADEPEALAKLNGAIDVARKLLR